MPVCAEQTRGSATVQVRISRQRGSCTSGMAGVSARPFALTPDLFPEEREEHSQHNRQSTTPTMAIEPAILLPLLWEEVRGEGKMCELLTASARGRSAHLHSPRCPSHSPSTHRR